MVVDRSGPPDRAHHRSGGTRCVDAHACVVRGRLHAMDFSESEDHRAIRLAVRDVCSAFDDDYWLARDENHEFPWEFYAAMAKGGWIGIAMPEQYGGGGCGIQEASI